MNLYEAVIFVLEESGTPLHVNEITKRILSKALWKTSGRTPASTVGASIRSDIKKNGDTSRFVLCAPSTFRLRKPGPHGKTSFSFTESAQMVLEQFAERQPMHYREITDKAIKKGWLSSKGKTPEATMSAKISTSIERSKRRGEQPGFTQHGKGLVGLSEWVATGLESEIEKHNKKVRRELHKKLLEMDWRAFEKLVAKLLSKIGFEEVESTPKSSDKGIDVRATLLVGDVIRTRMAVQVKRWKHNVQAPTVQQVRGSLGVHEQGLIITTGNFSKGARKEADKKDATPVALMNGEQLVFLLVENEVGVLRKSHDLIELEDEEISIPESGT